MPEHEVDPDSSSATADLPTRKRRSRPWPFFVAFLALALMLVATAWWGGDFFLRSEIGYRVLNLRPDRLQIHYESARSPGPGRVEVRGLHLAGNSPRWIWQIRLDEGSARINLPALLSRRFEAREIRGRGLHLEFQRRTEQHPRVARRTKPARKRWSVHLPNFAVDDIRYLAWDDLELLAGGTMPAAASAGEEPDDPSPTAQEPDASVREPGEREPIRDSRASGWIRFKVRGEMEVRDLRLALHDGQLVLQDEPVVEIHRAIIEAESEPFVAREHDAFGRLKHFTAEAHLDCELADFGFLDYYFSGAPWLRLEGGGRLVGEARLRDGHLHPPTQLLVQSPALEARLLDTVSRGQAALELRVTSEEGADPAHPGGQLVVTFDDFTVARAGAATSHVRGSGFRLTATTPDVALDRPLDDLEIHMQLPPSTVPDLTVYNAYLPAEGPLRFLRGDGQISADLKLSTQDGTARGHIDFAARRAQMKMGKGRFRGDLKVTTRLRSTDLAERRFSLDGSRLRLDQLWDMTAGGAREASNDPWWAEVEVKEGALAWEQPLRLDARLTARARDPKPVVTYFTGTGLLAKTFRSLFDEGLIEGEADIRMGAQGLALDRLDIQGDDLRLLARLRLAGPSKKGLFYARYKALDAGLEMLGEERKLKLIKPREWFDAYPKWPEPR